MFFPEIFTAEYTVSIVSASATEGSNKLCSNKLCSFVSAKYQDVSEEAALKLSLQCREILLMMIVSIRRTK